MIPHLIFAFLLALGFSLMAYADDGNSFEPIQPLHAIAVDVKKVALGDRLFHEPLLSGDNSISCAHCHHLENGGTDNLPFSFGIEGAVGEMNSPTVFNAALNIAQFWDGRAKTLEDQIDGPLLNPKEMASNWPDVIAKLNSDKTYVTAFDQLYKGGINEKNVKHAIAEFQRSLITVDSRFDQYLRGNKNAITDEEKQGYKLFKGFGCAACHQGENVGGNLFQTLGIIEDYFNTYNLPKPSDNGRFNVTQRKEDMHKFKVPSLRLVTLTAPYFHDGKFISLESAIRTMGQYQLGINISDTDITSIIAFLHTLPGKHPKLGKEQ